MKEDQVISMAVEAGAELDDGFLYIHTRVCSGFIGRFAKLVEQATLERAAKVCDAESFDSFERESRTRFAGDNETAHEHNIEKLAYAYVAKKIRVLKTKGE